MNKPCAQHAHPPRLIQPTLGDLTDRLRAKDRRVTAPRQAILNVLRRHAKPLTNKEIHAALGTGDCNLATVYRTVRALEQMSLVMRSDFGDGVARYELVTGGGPHHHHHLVCNTCSTVVEVEDCFPEALEQELARRHGFQGVTHRLEFFGTCPRCQARTEARPSASPERPAAR